MLSGTNMFGIVTKLFLISKQLTVATNDVNNTNDTILPHLLTTPTTTVSVIHAYSWMSKYQNALSVRDRQRENRRILRPRQPNVSQSKHKEREDRT